jgi:hypothetical protein
MNLRVRGTVAPVSLSGAGRCNQEKGTFPVCEPSALTASDQAAKSRVRMFSRTRRKAASRARATIITRTSALRPAPRNVVPPGCRTGRGTYSRTRQMRFHGQDADLLTGADRLVTNSFPCTYPRHGVRTHGDTDRANESPTGAGATRNSELTVDVSGDDFHTLMETRPRGCQEPSTQNHRAAIEGRIY